MKLFDGSRTADWLASILHTHNGKDLREIQELLRNIGPIVRYTQGWLRTDPVEGGGPWSNFEGKVHGFPDRD